VDPTTKLLVRMDCSQTSTDPEIKGRIEWMKSDFKFNEDLDQSLFSSKPPDGFAVETGRLLLAPAAGNGGAPDLQIK
jgi:hypothetical protein